MSTNSPHDEPGNERESVHLVTMTVGEQLFGVPVLEVQDVLWLHNITPVPLAPPEITGSLNLRGRIVTALDMRLRLGLSPQAKDAKRMGVVVEHKDELYSLIIDKVGEVMSLPKADLEPAPTTLDPRWQHMANGIFRLKDALLVMLDITKVLHLSQSLAA